MASNKFQVAAMLRPVVEAGVTPEDAQRLRRIAITLRNWFELTCGCDRGMVTRQGEDGEGEPLFHAVMRDGTYARPGVPVADQEQHAMNRLKKIMAAYPSLGYYIQQNPCGPSLYILRPGDVPAGEKAESYYTRGVALYR